MLIALVSIVQGQDVPSSTAPAQSKLSESSAVIEKWTRIKSEPVAVEAAITELVSDVVLDLGDCFSNREIPIQLSLTNKLGIPVSFEDVVSSCGCLAGVPANIDLQPQKTIPIRLLLRVPKEMGEFGKSISILDKENGCRLKLVLKGKSKPYITLGSTLFPIKRKGRVSFETTLKLNMAGFKMDELKFKVEGCNELVGYRVVPETEDSGKLILDLLIDEDVEETSADLSVKANAWDELYSVRIQFPTTYNPSSRPKTLALRRNDQGVWTGKLLLQMAGLPDEGTHKVRGRTITESSGEIDVDFTVSYRRVNDVLRFAEVSIEKDLHELESKIEIDFVSAEDVKLTVPVNVFEA